MLALLLELVLLQGKAVSRVGAVRMLFLIFDGGGGGVNIVYAAVVLALNHFILWYQKASSVLRVRAEFSSQRHVHLPQSPHTTRSKARVLRIYTTRA